MARGSDFSLACWRTPDVTRHTWSLSVEAHFYLLWPFILLAIFKTVPSRLAVVIAIMFLAASLWRSGLFFAFHDELRVYSAPDTRLSGFMIGALIAVVAWRPTAQQGRAIAIAAVIVLIVAMVRLKFGHTAVMTWGGVAVDLAAAALIIAQVSDGRFQWLAAPWLVALGRWSYGIYLWHYPIARVVRLDLPPAAAFIVTACISTVLAAFTFRFIEKPARRYLEGKFKLRPIVAEPVPA